MNKNSMILKFNSLSENESFARNVISCFALRLNPSLAEISDIKTAVSEAVTNCIVHAYPNEIGEITLESFISDNAIHINVFDNGIGIDNLEEVSKPFCTTKENQERAGMGFTIMKTFMDDFEVVTEKGIGTKVYMSKKIKADK